MVKCKANRLTVKCNNSNSGLEQGSPDIGTRFKLFMHRLLHLDHRSVRAPDELNHMSFLTD